jgi:CubicO group peptidase (beta-lactamase class C family)
MKNVSIILLFAAIQLTAAAQGKKQSDIDSVCMLVKKFFNGKNASALYELTGKSFRAFLSDTAFRNVCTQNLFPLGEIGEIRFESYSSGVSKYKTKFNAVVLELLLGLDTAEKIEVFQFKPFSDGNTKKAERVLSTNPLISSMDKEVDSLVQPYITRQATKGLSIGVLKSGKKFYYGYGETAKGNNQIPDEHTIFEIGSISKTFTAALLADASMKGYVSLDDPISKYLPDTIPNLEYEGIPITLKTLANHSSGIPGIPSNLNVTDMANPFKDYDTNRLFSFYAHFKPVRKPGQQYEYSNLAVGTLGVILERIYNKKYESLIIEKICLPLNINETMQFIKKSDSSRFARGYNENGYYNSSWDFKAIAGAGAIRSTASDLLKYANANLGIAPDSLNKAIQLTHLVTFNKEIKVGLAWHII